jgi:hypothetical protein
MPFAGRFKSTFHCEGEGEHAAALAIMGALN